MRALRFVALSEDGKHLVLAPDVPEAIDSGERFLLPVDERLRAGSRGDLSRLGQIEIEIESALRPKEIQARIRAGETPEAVATVAGIRVERVMRYAWPVLQEREQVAERAHTARVKLEHSTQSPTLIELIEQRLIVSGTDAGETPIDWDARRIADGMWEVSTTWKTKSKTVTASWHYDISARTVFPANSDTVELIEPAPRLSAVPTSIEHPSLDDEAPTGPIPIIRDEPVQEPRRSRPVRARRPEPVADLFSAGDLDDASDPGQSANADRAIPDPDAGLALLDEVHEDEVHEPEEAPAEETPASSSSKDKKPRIPSWDDIVFGSKRRK